jgi:outer membrane protein
MLNGKLNTRSHKGNKHYGFIAFFVFTLLSLTNIFSPAFAKDSVSVGVVNVTFLMENAPQSEVASTQLKARFSPQEKKLAIELDEINQLETELNKIKESKGDVELLRQKERELRSRKRVRSRTLQDFREELRFARDAALDDVQKEVFKAIDEVRIQQGVDIVLQDYVSASQRVDITPLVLEHLKSKLAAPVNNQSKQSSQK